MDNEVLDGGNAAPKKKWITPAIEIIDKDSITSGTKHTHTEDEFFPADPDYIIYGS